MSRARRERTRAWWRERGPQVCGHCHHGYHVEMASWCVDCDEPVCPVCVVTIRARRVVLCPACAPAASADPHKGTAR